MRNWASSGRVKIDRANQHIHDLERRIDAFREEGPYYVMPELNPKGVEGVAFTVRVVHDIPTDLSAIAADAIHNLHVALDHLWQNVTRAGPTTRKNYFPAWKSTNELKANLGREKESPTKIARRVLCETDALWPDNPFRKIREFDDADKHDTMSLVACALTQFRSDLEHVYYGTPGPLMHFTMPFDNPFILEDGKVLYLWEGPVREQHVEHELAFEVAFGEGSVLKSEPVIPTLQYFAESVDGLASAFLVKGLLT